MKINNIGYLIKEGLKGIFLHGFMSFAAVCVTVACLLIVGTFSSLMVNLNIMVEELNNTNEVIVYIDETISDAEARSVGTQLNRVDNVLEATFVSNEEALENFVADYDNSSVFDGTDPETLQHRYVVYLENPRLLTETVTALGGISGVAEVVTQEELAEGFAMLQDVLRLVSMIVIGILLVVSLLIISNTVKLAMYDRRDEISIMKMVGATNSFIRLPFVVEGFALGMMGAAIAFGLEWLLYNYLVERISQIDIATQLFHFMPFTDGQLFVPMVLVFAGAGLFVGVVGSWTSIRKFMNV